MRENSIPVIIHHVDMDGWTSAWVVTKYLRDHNVTPKIFSFNYNWSTSAIEEFLEKNIDLIDDIYLVDISLPDAFMTKYASRITWIDHHGSAIAHVAELEAAGLQLKKNLSAEDIEGVRVSACELCWQVFFGESSQDMPEFVHLAGRYDVWDHSDSRTLMLNAYVGLHFKNSDENPPFLMKKFDRLCFATGLAIACGEGRDALEWRKRFAAIDSARNVRICYFDSPVGELQVAVINAPGLDSHYFDAVLEKYPYLAMAIFFHYEPRSKNWVISFRSLKPGFRSRDVMQETLENAYHGSGNILSMGGHPESCGATVKDIQPFLDLISL